MQIGFFFVVWIYGGEYIPMALKKMCQCGAIIDYADRYCSECEPKAKIDKAESNKIYDDCVRHLRDAKYTQFYHSKQWRQIVEIVRNMYNYIDIYSYYLLNKVEHGYICHHVRELKIDGWDDRLNANAIVYVTDDNHKAIHKLLLDDYEGTISMMQGLIKRYKEDFN